MALGPANTVGRTAELDRLGELLEALARGSGLSTAIEGEPGIGKTRMLTDLRGLAETRGHLVLSGTAAEYERDLPMAVWADALDSHLSAWDAARLEATDPEHLATLAGVFPALSDGEPPGDGVADERYRIHQAVRALLELIAQDTPVVLLLDDLHWADRASIDLIAALVRRPSAAPVLLALSFRAGMAPEAVAAALAVPTVTLIGLAPLDREASAELISEQPGSPRAQQIYAEGGGNPFYSLQLQQSAAPERSLVGDEFADQAGVPPLVAAALLEELGVLAPQARLLLEAAAVLGDPFEPELACEVAELDPESGLEALDELLDAKLLHPTAVPRRFAFRHPLVRRAVYEASKVGWRLAAHGRAAAAMRARGASAMERAHHVEYSAVQGDTDATAILVEAAAGSQPRSPQGAARWYAAALRLVPDAQREARFGLLTKLAAAERSTGDLASARESLVEALELAPADEPATRMRLTAACSASEHFIGRHEEAQARLHAAFEALPDHGSQEGVEALMALSTGGFFTMETGPMCDFALRAAQAAKELHDESLSFAAVALLAHALTIADRLDEAAGRVDEARCLLESLDDEALAARLDSVNRLSWGTLGVHRFQGVIEHSERGMRVARRTGQDQFAPLLLAAQAVGQVGLGSLAAATALAIEALETARIAANDYLTCSVLHINSYVATSVGDLELARRYAEEAVELVEVAPGRRIPATAGLRLIVLRMEMGEPTDVDPGELGGGWDLPLMPLMWRSGHLETLTRIALAADDLALATRYASAAQAAAVGGLALERAIALRTSAAVRLAAGDPAEATESALASAMEADSIGARLEAARSRALAGRAEVGAGRRAEGITALRDAEAEFAELGAQRARDDARRELRRLGARTETRGPVAGGTSGLAALSTREREVADLVRDRKTNKEIAADLFLSEKTIESHLRNIFLKLEVGSRVEVARAVERADRAASP